MWHRTLTLLLLSSLLLLAACSTEAVNRGAYNAVYQKDCLDRTGSMDCDPQHPSYDTYKKQREAELKPAP